MVCALVVVVVCVAMVWVGVRDLKVVRGDDNRTVSASSDTSD